LRSANRGDSKPLDPVEAIALRHEDGSSESPSRPRRSLPARVGLALMAASFLVYLVYGLLLFLPLAPSSLAGIAVSASLASWGLFSLGAALAGRDAAAQFMHAFARMWGRWRRGARP
jgi:hypothetical protein